MPTMKMGLPTAKRISQVYGLSPEEYSQILDFQEERCAICKRPYEDIYNSGSWLCVDHNHTTGAVRGLLCIKCNLMLRHVEENIPLLEAVTGYLQSPPTSRIWAGPKIIPQSPGDKRSVDFSGLCSVIPDGSPYVIGEVGTAAWALGKKGGGKTSIYIRLSQHGLFRVYAKAKRVNRINDMAGAVSAAIALADMDNTTQPTAPRKPLYARRRRVSMEWNVATLSGAATNIRIRQVKRSRFEVLVDNTIVRAANTIAKARSHANEIARATPKRKVGRPAKIQLPVVSISA